MMMVTMKVTHSRSGAGTVGHGPPGVTGAPVPPALPGPAGPKHQPQGQSVLLDCAHGRMCSGAAAQPCPSVPTLGSEPGAGLGWSRAPCDAEHSVHLKTGSPLAITRALLGEKCRTGCPLSSALAGHSWSSVSPSGLSCWGHGEGTAASSCEQRWGSWACLAWRKMAGRRSYQRSQICRVGAKSRGQLSAVVPSTRAGGTDWNIAAACEEKALSTGTAAQSLGSLLGTIHTCLATIPGTRTHLDQPQG